MLIRKGKRVFLWPTLLAVAISALVTTALALFALPWLGLSFTLAAVVILTVFTVAVVSYIMLVAPLQGITDLIHAHLSSNPEVLTGHHGFTPDTLRQHRRIGERFDTVSTLIDGFHQLAAGVMDKGSGVAIAAAEVSFAAETLAHKVQMETAMAREIAASTRRITALVSTNAESALAAAQFAQDAQRVSVAGQAAVTEAAAQMQETNRQAGETSGIVASLEQKSRQIQSITSVIRGIAEQTNLLALNAAIEAARAGEQGRGFAVVADEVRNLAHKTTTATGEITNMVDEISGGIQQAVGTMMHLAQAISAGSQLTGQVGAQLREMGEQVERSRAQAEEIARCAGQQRTEVEGISSAIESVSQHLETTEQQVRGLTQQADRLSEMGEAIYAMLMGFNSQCPHKTLCKEAITAAQAIQQVLETAIAQGRIRLEDVFDNNYQVIPGSKPPKYHTRYDTLTDELFPPIQEPILNRHPEVIYAGAVDTSGYFPTHNRRFSQPLTGDYQRDLVNNRTKRLFNDRVGARCGAHTQPFLLQTYKRDTGEVIHDLSVPIHVHGRQWGGFRIGYLAAT